MSAALTLPPVAPEAEVSADDLRAAVPGARVTVVGGARSGLAAARLLARHGADVFLSDHGPAEDGAAAALAAALAAAGVASEFGGHTARASEADWLVVSPGVPTTVSLVQEAMRAGRPVYAEVEVASWFCPGPIVAVTGSNGKTTTTTLLGHVLKTAGRAHVVAGNIGRAFSDVVDDMTPETVAVLEVSSFQLDHVVTFRPRVAVLLNITPDHLDRYAHDVERYAAAKFRLVANAREGDWLVYNPDDDRVRRHVEALAAERGLTPVGVSAEREPSPGGFVRDGRVVLSLPDSGAPGAPPTDVDLMPTEDLALRGRHNLYNSLAAAVAARAVEVRSAVVRESLASFEGVPHRLEAVRTVNGVRFVNDSKATNVNAVWYALESFPASDGPRVVLIAGGRDKGNDYGPLQPLVAERVKGIVAIGEGADAVEAELGPHTARVARADSMAEAVQYARLIAEPGDTVLLSPACASFDMFDDYEDRGDTFKRIVHAL